MEAAAVLAFAGLGYAITQLSKPKNEEGFQAGSSSRAADTPLGSAPRGASQELDLRYQNLMGNPPPPGEPNPGGVQGTLLNYAPPPLRTIPMNPSFQPRPEPIDSATPEVALNPAGIEAQPNYLSGDFITSALTGQTIATADFTHNNMVPFYGGRVKQNVGPQANTNVLDNYTGSGVNQIAKKEVETLFDPKTMLKDLSREPFGNPYGLEAATDFVQSRIVDPRSRAGERPFEPVRVAPGVNEGFAASGKGGFQQFEVNQYMIDNIRRTDDIRTADNPKLTYNQPVVPGQHFIGTSAQETGEVRKYRPDRFYTDEGGERYFVTTGGLIKETTRPIQVMKHVSRPETSSEFIGPAGAQEFGESYVMGSYRTPMAQQHGGAGYRNADMTSYTSADTDAPENDYGRSGYEVRPNERNLTSERTMGLNLVPAEAGATTIHYMDENRPTRRQEAVGNIRQTGTPVGYADGAPSVQVWDPNDVARTTVREGTAEQKWMGHAGPADGAPAITVWDPNDIARTTLKQGTINWNWFGQAAPAADGATRLKVYDPDDIARPTQKHQISAKSEHFGSASATNKDFTSHDAAYNMRLNPNKQQIAKGRDPMHGNGGALAVFDGNIHQTTRKLDSDIVNDRANAVNRVSSVPTGVGDLGLVRPRVPLKLDISRVRNGMEVVAAVNNNPLMASQNLARNAEHDEALLQELLATL